MIQSGIVSSRYAIYTLANNSLKVSLHNRRQMKKRLARVQVLKRPLRWVLIELELFRRRVSSRLRSAMNFCISSPISQYPKAIWCWVVLTQISHQSPIRYMFFSENIQEYLSVIESVSVVQYRQCKFVKKAQPVAFCDQLKFVAWPRQYIGNRR